MYTIPAPKIFVKVKASLLNIRLNDEFCPMRILIAAATAAEIAGYPKNNPNLDFLITGIGVPSALYRLQHTLSTLSYGCVIQAGLAGTYDENSQPINSVALVSADCFADVGFEENGNFEPLHASALYRSEHTQPESCWLSNPNPLLESSGLPAVRAITVNRVSDSTLQMEQMRQHFSPVLESMEGACLHWVGNHMQVPYLQLRSVSNHAGVRNKAEWDIQGALRSLHHAMDRIIVAALSTTSR